MRSFLTTLALASTILTATDAVTLVQRRNGEAPRVVQQEIQRKRVSDPIARDQARMRRRQNDLVQVGLTNEQTLYFMNMRIGTPAQSLKLHIDTGSSDLWVNSPDSNLCEQSYAPCSVSGTYNANSSSTYNYLNSAFNISYVDGSGSAGDYVSDVVRFGDVTIRNQQFGVGYTSSSREGVVGIGYPLNEVAVSYGYAPYPNIPVSLVQQGAINTNAYSLWLNDLAASKGSILFGGVDTSKYTGTLQTLPIIKVFGQVYAEFLIGLTAVGANGKSGSIANNLAYAALLDSGSSLMYLPDSIAQGIFKQLNAQYDSNQGAAFVDCSLRSSSQTIDFTFSSPTIRIAMSELVIEAGIANGSPICILGIGLSGSATPVLGDTFLRSAYVVYDIAANEIALAQTDFSGGSSNVMEIASPARIPGATTVQNAVTSVVSASGNPVYGGFSSVSATVGNSGAMATAAPGAGLRNLALAGAAAGALFAL